MWLPRISDGQRGARTEKARFISCGETTPLESCVVTMADTMVWSSMTGWYWMIWGKYTSILRHLQIEMVKRRQHAANIVVTWIALIQMRIEWWHWWGISRWLDEQLKIILGNDAPENPTLASISANGRALISMASLGRTLLSSFADVSSWVSELLYSGHFLVWLTFSIGLQIDIKMVNWKLLTNQETYNTTIQLNKMETCRLRYLDDYMMAKGW